MAANVPISSSVIPNSTACRHLAMMSLLVRSNTNEESTNESPVPWLPVSWNRSSSPYLGKLVLVPREQPLPSGKCGRAFPQVYEALPFSVADERLLARKLPHHRPQNVFLGLPSHRW